MRIEPPGSSGNEIFQSLVIAEVGTDRSGLGVMSVVKYMLDLLPGRRIV